MQINNRSYQKDLAIGFMGKQSSLEPACDFNLYFYFSNLAGAI